MDFGIKFEVEKLTGYALRVIRVKEASDAVAMALVEYREGKSSYLTALQLVSCYLTGFCVTVRLEGEGEPERALFLFALLREEKTWKT